MKLLLIFAVLCILSSESTAMHKYIVDKWTSLMQPHKQYCIRESNVNPEHVHHMLRKGYKLDEPPFHEFMRCMYVKLGMMSEHGEFHEQQILKQADYLNYNLLKKCLNEARHERSHSRKSYKLCECIIRGLEDPCSHCF